MPHLSRLLVLEDEPIIALDIEDTLERGGFRDITVLRSCHDALEYLKQTRPDAALLDVHLTDGACNAVAEELQQKAVPFVIYSGVEEDIAQYGEIFGKGRWLLKPALSEDLLAAMLHCIANIKRD
jgi:DNA-binding response OmpR family regulator